MKIQFARLVVLVGFVALVIGFARTGTAWGELATSNTFEFANGAAWDMPQWAFVCRGFNDGSGDEIDVRASETLTIHGSVGDDVEVEILKADGPIRFADNRENPFKATLKDPTLEVPLRSELTDTTAKDDTMRITWYHKIETGEVVKEDRFADGAHAFVLRSWMHLIETELPAVAQAQSPPAVDGGDVDSDYGWLMYTFGITSHHVMDQQVGKKVTGKLRLEGEFYYLWTVTWESPSLFDRVEFDGSSTWKSMSLKTRWGRPPLVRCERMGSGHTLWVEV